MYKSTTNLILAFLTGAAAGTVVGMLLHNENKPPFMDKLSKAAGLIADAVKIQLEAEAKAETHVEAEV